MESKYAIALSAWKNQLDENQVLDASTAQQTYGPNTIGIDSSIAGALLIDSADNLPAILEIANELLIPLYPISTGRNWGYGGANPVRKNSIIVDLSPMDNIVSFDPESGLVTLEPGVTQQNLRDFLDQQQQNFLVPVTGAGPNCSLVGNALERGYGITPYSDHFAAVTTLEVILADGSTYRTPLSEMGGEGIDQAFKWGVGPYLDGIFTQGNFGIVTKMTIALAPTPERVTGFFFSVAHDSQLEQAVECIQSVLRDVGQISGSINLMNKRRVISMIEPYPENHGGEEGIIPQPLLDKLGKRNQTLDWTGAGALYGNARIVKAARAIIRKKLKGITARLVFFTPGQVSKLDQLASVLPGKLGHQARQIFGTLNKTLQLLAGSPSEVALPLAYWRSGTRPTDGRPMNPAKDGSGLIWYAPLVPMKPTQVRQYVQLVEAICRKYRIEPLITLTSISDRCFDSTVPLLFDRQDPTQVSNAQACYDELFEAGRKLGFMPYRTSVKSMQRYTGSGTTYWNVVKQLKLAVDKNNIIAPGRYSPLE